MTTSAQVVIRARTDPLNKYPVPTSMYVKPYLTDRKAAPDYGIGNTGMRMREDVYYKSNVSQKA
jgi:hypothetical protein